MAERIGPRRVFVLCSTPPKFMTGRPSPYCRWIDPDGLWRTALACHMRSVGIPVDINLTL
jgi:hypothetical protein